MVKTVTAKSAVVAATLTFLASTLAARFAHAELVDRISAIVNDDIVTLSDIEDFTGRLKTGGLVDDQLVPDDETRQGLIKDSSRTLNKLIDAKIVDAEVRKQNLSIPFERVEQEIRSIARGNKMTRDDLKSTLQAKGISFAWYQEFIKTGLERQALVEKSVTSKIKISEDDVLAMLIAEGRASETQAFEYSLAHILLRSDKSGGVEGAKTRAQTALQKLKEGIAFDRVAADHSEDPNFEVGGIIGTVRSDELPKDLEQAILKLSPGEWTQAMPTKGGVHIVRMLKRKLIPDPKTEAEKNRARAVLGEKAFRRQYDIWLEQLRSEAFVRVNK